MKEKLFEKLTQNLDEITKHYRILLEALRKEKEYLVKTEIEKLNENNLLKEQTLLKVKSLDGLRLNYASELAQAIGMDHREPRLLEIAQKIGGREGERLRSIHGALDMVVKRMVSLNKENAVYAESALKNVNSSMNNIKDTLTGGQKTYQKKGTFQPGSDRSGHLVSREA